MNYHAMATLLDIPLIMNMIEDEKNNPTDTARGNQNMALEVERKSREKMVSVREWQLSMKTTCTHD